MLKQREIHPLIEDNQMTNVTVRAMDNARRRKARSAIERDRDQRQGLTVRHIIREDKAGRCYTYRGVSYCYR